jgi:hypothetical protein
MLGTGAGLSHGARRRACFNSCLEPRVRGPFGDRTLCTVMNDLPVCARLARPQTGHTIAVTSGNVLPLLTGGQVGRSRGQASPQLLVGTVV